MLMLHLFTPMSIIFIDAYATYFRYRFRHCRFSPHFIDCFRHTPMQLLRLFAIDHYLATMMPP